MTETTMGSTPSKSHPKGLYLLFVTEMWERFSYYGMRAIFTLYMTKALLFDKAISSNIYGIYTGLVYLTPLLGGFIADRYWGNRRSIIFGGILMAAGQFFMFLSGSSYTDVDTATFNMIIGLGLLILGNGFFKPNISTMVGSLYPDGDKRVDSAFTIFYMGINMGAMLAPVICGGLGDTGTNADFKWGFLAACIGMLVSLAFFLIYKNKLIVRPDGTAVGMPPAFYNKKEEGAADKVQVKPNYTVLLGGLALLIGLFVFFYTFAEFDIVGSLIFSTCIALPIVIILDPSLSKVERQRVAVIYIVAFFVIFFWSAFEQAGASLTYFAEEQTDREILGWTMPASLFQIFNALFIVILAPISVSVWTFLSSRKSEPSSPVKQSLGLAFLAIGYLVIAMGVDGIGPSAKVSMLWLVSLYLIHTIGELCLSPIGLSMVVKLAPVRFVSLLMGVWFLSTATANYFAGTLSALYPEEVKAAGSFKLTEKMDVNTLRLDTAIWAKAADETVKIPVVEFTETKEGTGSLNTLTGEQADVSLFKLKLVKATGKNVENAALIKGSQNIVLLKDESNVEKWNLAPTKPKFVGFEIANLYDFFMIFVYMAGGAAIILFLLSKLLIKMSHGKL